MIPDAARTIMEAIRKRMLDVRALPNYVIVGHGVPGGWPTPKRDPEARKRQPAPRTLERVVTTRLYHAKVGRSFLKAWGSTDKAKLSRRRARLPRQTGAPERTAA